MEIFIMIRITHEKQYGIIFGILLLAPSITWFGKTTASQHEPRNSAQLLQQIAQLQAQVQQQALTIQNQQQLEQLVAQTLDESERTQQQLALANIQANLVPGLRTQIQN